MNRVCGFHHRNLHQGSNCEVATEARTVSRTSSTQPSGPIEDQIAKCKNNAEYASH